MHGKVFFSEKCIETPKYNREGQKIFFVHLREIKSGVRLRFEVPQELRPGMYYKAKKKRRTLVYYPTFDEVVGSD